MSLDAALYTRATGFAGLTALVSTRLYPDRLPQNPTLPAVVYSRVSGDHGECMESADGLGEARFNFTAWATTKASAIAIREQLRLCFQSYVGTLSGIAVTVHQAADTPDIWADGDDAFSAGIDFLIYYAETRPS